jgi:protein-arginine kinase activator protein McsA
METKICSKCKLQHSIENFNKDKTRRDGLSYICKQCAIDKKNKYINDNKEKVLLSYKIYRENNKERILKNKKENYYKNIDKIKIYRKKYNKENREYFNKWEKNKVKTDILFKISRNMRSRIRVFLKKTKIIKNNKTFDIVGCEPSKLKIYIEQQFQNGMSWDNYGVWHIDHIIPLSSAKSEEEIYKLCHYTNLQPLWGIDNIKKGNKISPI